MARRRTSKFEDIIEIVSRFPWWVGCVLALVSYVALHFVAGIEVAKPTGASGLGSFAGKQLCVTLAGFGQYVLPGMFGFGALVSILKGSQQKKLFEKVEAQSGQDSLFEMTWQEFEDLTGEFFRRCGYAVKQTGGSGPDGGVDLILSKGNDRYLVQCKQWKSYKVGVQVVRELYGVMSSQGAAGGFVITAGEFSDEARRFTDGLNIQLFDGSYLHKMIREVKQGTSKGAAKTLKPVNIPPVCSKCGQDMVKRVARQGRHSGKEFWGCSSFPDCRQTVSIN